jgi:hypothetical protein
LRKRLPFYLAVLVISCGVYAAVLYDTYYPPLKPIQRYLGTSIPEDAEDIQAIYTWVFQGGRFHLQFGIPSGSLNSFVTYLCGENDLSSENNRIAQQNRHADPEWFLNNPDSISISARCFTLGGANIDILVDESDSTSYRVYIRGSLG